MYRVFFFAFRRGALTPPYENALVTFFMILRVVEDALRAPSTFVTYVIFPPYYGGIFRPLHLLYCNFVGAGLCACPYYVLYPFREDDICPYVLLYFLGQ